MSDVTTSADQHIFLVIYLTVCSRSSPARAAAVPPYPSEPSEGPGDEKTEEKKKPVFSHALNENFGTEELISELKEKEGFGNRGEVVLLAQLVLAFLVIFPPMQLRGLIFMCGMIIFQSSCCEIRWICKFRTGHIMVRVRCKHGLKSAGALALIFGAISTALSFVGLGKSFSPLVTPRKSNVIVSNGMFQVCQLAIVVNGALSSQHIAMNSTSLTLYTSFVSAVHEASTLRWADLAWVRVVSCDI